MVIRVVATADNHLSRYYDRLVPQKLALRRKYLRDGFRAAVEHAIAWQAQIFCICGDLFDSPDPRNTERAFVAHCLAQLHQHGIAVCAISGNHDTPRQSITQGGTAPLDVYRQLGALTLFGSVTTIESIMLTIDGQRVAIGGLAPDPAAPPGSDPLAIGTGSSSSSGLTWRARDQGATTGILLLHGQVEGYTTPEEEGAIFTLASLRAQTDADLILMGDIHRPRTFPLGNGRLLVIPGATERMTFGEAEDVPGFMALEYTAAQGWRAERIAVSAQPRAEITIRTVELPADDVGDYLVARVRAVANDQTLVRLTLAGVISREAYHALDLRPTLERINQSVFQCQLDTGGLVLEDTQHQLAPRGLRLSQQDEIAAYTQELLATATDPAEQAIICEALGRLIGEYDAAHP